MKINEIEIEGVVCTTKSPDDWLEEFLCWIEANNESFGGMTKLYEEDEQ